MGKIISSITLFFCIISLQLKSQVFPKEGAELNYRIIGFMFPATDGANAYLLEIAAGKCTTDEAFKKKLIHTSRFVVNKEIAEVPDFGSNYTWRFTNLLNNSILSKSPLYHFSTGVFEHPDSPATRLRIIKQAEKHNGAYIFLNSPCALYDMNGKPVWYLPRSENIPFTNKSIRDLKATGNGTITFIVAGNDAYEINYNGDVLWKAPNSGIVSGDSSEHYNHELTKLNNGHYMVLGQQLTLINPDIPAMRPIPAPQMNTGRPNPLANSADAPQRLNHRVIYGTIMEYDKKGNILWSWKSSSFFPKSDLVNYPNNLRHPMHDVHQNSFAFDEKNKVVYLSYKNIHRILKLKYPDGSVLKSYGEIYKPGMQHTGVGSYCFQHSIKQSINGDLYLFNNNSCHRECTPEIIVLREPVGNENYPQIIWNFEFPVEPLVNLQENMPGPPHKGGGESTVGGNVMELPDNSMFASLCSPYSQLFIISRDKKVLWNAIAERWNPTENKWMSIPQYRASIIKDRNDLEQLVWSAYSAN